MIQEWFPNHYLPLIEFTEDTLICGVMLSGTYIMYHFRQHGKHCYNDMNLITAICTLLAAHGLDMAFMNPTVSKPASLAGSYRV